MKSGKTPSARLLAGGVLAAAAMQPLAPCQSQIRFRDMAAIAGLDFVLAHHPTPRKHLIETMAGGVAAFDYDGDGRTDLYFTNGAAVPSLEKESPRYWNRLYRNLGDLRFADMTERAGVQAEGYCIGAAAADYDNDGDTDLFVAGVNRSLLYRNGGDGTFREVARAAGVSGAEWAVGGAWLDYDGDGHLDLFVVNYLKWSPDFDTFCGDAREGVRSYCDPSLFEGLPNRLYRNRGDGTFEDVSEQAGIADHVGKGMSAAVADYDGDGHPDIFVANDKLPNFLFRNLGDGSFEEVALFAGVALQDHGKAVSGMGSDFRDADNDGFPDIVFTALAGESFPLFRHTGSGGFRDATFQSGMGALTYDRSGWGIGLADFDNDGRKDIFAANSHVNDTVAHFEAARYELENSIFANQGAGRFGAVPEAGFEAARAHRGSAFADFDGDGLLDIVVSSLGERAELWRNVTATENHWLEVALQGRRSNRDAVGAVVRIGNQSNRVSFSVGYASSSHTPLHFGLGRAGLAQAVEIRWPSGRRQTLADVPANQVLEVREPE